MAAGTVVGDIRSYIAVEGVPGVAPTAGSYIPFVLQNSTVSPNPISLMSPNRAYGGLISARRRVRTEYSGNISGQFHPDAIDLYLESWLRERFRGTEPQDAPEVSAMATSGDTEVTFDVAVPLYTEFTLAGANHTSPYTVVAEGTGNARTIQPALADDVSANTAIDITVYPGDVLVAGKKNRTLMLEDRIPKGEGGANSFNRNLGMQLTGGTIGFEQDAFASFNAPVLCRDFVEASAAITGLTERRLTDTENKVASSGIDVMKLVIKGLAGSTALGTSERELEVLNFTFENNPSAVRGQTRVGQDKLKGIAIGAFRPTLSGTAYFDELYPTFRTAFRANEQFQVIFEVEVTTGKKYRFTFPVCEFDNVSYNVPEDDSADVEVPLAIQPLATEDATSNGLGDSVFADRKIEASFVKVERNQ